MKGCKKIVYHPARVKNGIAEFDRCPGRVVHAWLAPFFGLTRRCVQLGAPVY